MKTITYRHLSEGDRETIAYLKACGKTIREIAFYLSRPPSTISRELKRNSEPTRYRPHIAQYKALKRRSENHLKASCLQADLTLQKQVRKWIRRGWSPELISGRLKRENNGQKMISHEAIYQWIYAHERTLIKYLTRAHMVRFRRHARHRRQYRIPNRVSIGERPLVINARQVSGHWETDQLWSRGRSALQVLIERKTRFTHIRKVSDKSAQRSYRALVHMFSDVSNIVRKSITYDNGSENSLHTYLNEKFNMKSYFCEPYHAWEKGSVENTNGLIRRFLPKRTNFDNLHPKQIKRIQMWLNHRPRKCLDFQTPAEALKSESVALRP